MTIVCSISFTFPSAKVPASAVAAKSRACQAPGALVASCSKLICGYGLVTGVAMPLTPVLLPSLGLWLKMPLYP